MKEEISLDIAMSKDEMDKIKNILGSAKGLRHYGVELKNGEYLDLVEYKDYQQLETNWKELKKCIKEWITYHSVCDEDYKELNVLLDVESKMQELEQGKDESINNK